MSGAIAIVLAAGRGERMGTATPKALIDLGDGPMLVRAVERASACASVAGIVVVAPSGWEEAVADLVEPYRVTAILPGGPSRQASVQAGLGAVPDDVGAVVCHDAARPFASTRLFDRALDALDGWDGVVPILPVVETVKRVRDDAVEGTEPREPLALAQTPQAFVAARLRGAHEQAEREGFTGSDDAVLLERAGFRVRAIAGEPRNRKITTLGDLDPPWVRPPRVGVGFDVHPFTRGRPLMLGGVRFDEHEGLAGHSDGDAVCHALADALLGAAGLGDVGEQFPDTDPSVEGIAGLALLGEVVQLLGAVGLAPVTVDLTLLAERPRVAPERDRMRSSLAGVLGIGRERVSVKATRPEGLGLSGDGIGCLALAVLERA